MSWILYTVAILYGIGASAMSALAWQQRSGRLAVAAVLMILVTVTIWRIAQEAVW